MHTVLQEKRKNEWHFPTETSASVMGFSLQTSFVRAWHLLKHAKSIWHNNILQQVLCLFRHRQPLVRLSRTHLTNYMVLSYLQNIKKLLFSSIPMIPNLAMQYKEEEKVIGNQNSCSKSTLNVMCEEYTLNHSQSSVRKVKVQGLKSVQSLKKMQMKARIPSDRTEKDSIN